MGPYLVNVGFRAGYTSDNLLDEARDLVHDIDAVHSLAKLALNDTFDGLAIVALAVPDKTDTRRFRPPVVSVLFDGGVSRLVGTASYNHAIVLHNGTDVDDGGAVRRWGGELHHHSRVVGTLEVNKVPFGGSVLGLHALQSVGVQSLALEVNWSLLGGDGTLGCASWPESVAQGSPRVLGIGSEQRSAGLSALYAWGGTGNLQVDNGALVVCALDGVGVAVLGKLERAVVGVECRLVRAEVDVVQRGGAPQVRLAGFAREDFDVELGGNTNAALRLY